jgi:hypothetical protein
MMLLIALPLFTFAAKEEKQKADKQETAAETLTTFQGTIGDMSNYAPLSDVTLTVSAHDSDFKKTVKTDEEGKFVVENLPAGLYKVRFEKKGYEPGTYQSLVVREGSSQNFGFLLFEK